MRYTSDDEWRVQITEPPPAFVKETYRSPWRRDWARLIHSPSLRRLQGKTQLFPGGESDFFRNRLTHSLEVAQIAKSIAIKLNHDLTEAGEDLRIEPDIAEFAGLAHDLGHPPFGHFGEETLDRLMARFGGFEGNAQTLRLIVRIEKRRPIEGTAYGIDRNGIDRRIGLNLTARSIASILKYDRRIPLRRANKSSARRPIKGYYASEKDVVDRVKAKVCGGKKHSGRFKTVECQIMDIADDIAYSTYDLEDSFKAGFLKPVDLLCASEIVLRNVARKVSRAIGRGVSPDDVREEITKSIFFDMFKLPDDTKDLYRSPSSSDLDDLHFLSITMACNVSDALAQDGYQRTGLTSKLVGAFVRGAEIAEINRENPALSTVRLKEDERLQVEILKHFVYESQILSPKVRLLETAEVEPSSEPVGTSASADWLSRLSL
ncbi:MAG: dNTP triphosphohydrolase [Sedimentisphaerales bacterium]|nr:dNTP triphosphohydrolase [Sedimentisphaerales bacterium]